MVSTAAFEPGEAREPPTNLGRYVRLDTLGAGGMGAVYSAWDRELQRRVALKILHTDDRERFLREAQALARLKHPNVVVVHDVGSTDGLDYIAMELVEGSSLRVWASQPHTWREVLAIYLQAGRGLVAAHAADLVHRDFKPDNVLIGNDGSVRVADFGLARATTEGPEQTMAVTGAPLLEGSLTRTGALVGTPRYMAPEQREGRSPDPHMDQYSFAVSMWESLFGRVPGELAPAKQAATGRVPSWLRAALERACAPKPQDRFPSVAALLEAIDRDTPRTRRMVLGAAAIVVAGVAGGLVWYHQTGAAVCTGAEARLTGVWDPAVRKTVEAAFRATGSSHAAETFARVAVALDERARGWIAMRTEACEATAVRHEQSDTLLDLRVQCLDRRLVQVHALVDLFAHADRALVDNAVPAAYKVGELASCADARALLDATPPPADAATRARVAALRDRIAEANALDSAARYVDAERAYAAIVTDARALDYPPVLGEALMAMVTPQMNLYEDRAAKVALDEAMPLFARANDDRLLALAWIRLINVVGVGLSRPGDAVAMRQAAELAVVRAGDDLRQRALLEHNLGSVLKIQGKYEEALALHQAALELLQQRLGPDDPELLITRNSIGVVLMLLGRYPEALRTYRETLALSRRIMGPEHPWVAGILINIGNVHLRTGDYGEAIRVLETALAIQEKTIGPEHPDTAETLGSLGDARRALGDRAHAVADLERARVICEKKLPADHLHLASALRRVGVVWVETGKVEQGRAAIERAFAILEKKLDPQSPVLAEALLAMGIAQTATGKLADADATYARALALARRDHDGANEDAATAELAIAALRLIDHRPGDALAGVDHAIATREHLFGVDHPQVASALVTKAELLLALHRPAEATPLLARAIHALEPGGPPDDLAHARAVLGRAR